jgi:hypothetical protein
MGQFAETNLQMGQFAETNLQMGQFPFAETITTLQSSLHRKADTWGRSYDRDLQRQRCKFLQRHE